MPETVPEIIWWAGGGAFVLLMAYIGVLQKQNSKMLNDLLDTIRLDIKSVEERLNQHEVENARQYMTRQEYNDSNKEIINRFEKAFSELSLKFDDYFRNFAKFQVSIEKAVAKKADK